MSKNIGNIPGYYWDEEKQKYFRISNTHVATNAGAAKYTRQNVENSQREAKRLKASNQHTERLCVQTVNRSEVLQHTNLAGATLQRELGAQSRQEDRNSVHESWLSMLRPSSFTVLPSEWRGYGVLEQFHEPSWNGLVAAIERGPSGGMVLSGMTPPGAAPARLDPSYPILSNYQVLASFDSSITSLSVGEFDEIDGLCRSIFVSAAHPDHSRPRSPNAYMGLVVGPYVKMSRDLSRRDFKKYNRYTTVGYSNLEHGLSSAMNDGAHGRLVVGTNMDAYVYSQVDSIPNGRLGVSGLYFAIDWLNHNIVTAGYVNTGSDDSHVSGRGVLLWDTRSNGSSATSLRFKLPQTLKIRDRIVPNFPSGVTAMRKHGHQVIAADPKKIRLFDTRMSREHDGATRAVMEIKHQHYGPRLAFAANQDGVVVAADRKNNVVAYSTLTGRAIQTLPRSATQPQSSDGTVARISSLSFEDTRENSSVVRACQGREVVEWSVGGDQPDSDDEDQARSSEDEQPESTIQDIESNDTWRIQELAIDNSSDVSSDG